MHRAAHLQPLSGIQRDNHPSAEVASKRGSAQLPSSESSPPSHQSPTEGNVEFDLEVIKCVYGVGEGSAITE